MNNDIYEVDMRDNHNEHDVIEVKASNEEDALSKAASEYRKFGYKLYSNPSARLREAL